MIKDLYIFIVDLIFGKETAAKDYYHYYDDLVNAWETAARAFIKAHWAEIKVVVPFIYHLLLAAVVPFFGYIVYLTIRNWWQYTVPKKREHHYRRRGALFHIIWMLRVYSKKEFLYVFDDYIFKVYYCSFLAICFWYHRRVLRLLHKYYYNFLFRYKRKKKMKRRIRRYVKRV